MKSDGIIATFIGELKARPPFEACIIVAGLLMMIVGILPTIACLLYFPVEGLLALCQSLANFWFVAIGAIIAVGGYYIFRS